MPGLKFDVECNSKDFMEKFKLMEAEVTKTQEQMRKLEEEVTKSSRSIAKEGDQMASSFKKIGMAIGAYFSVQQLTNFAQSIVKVRAQIESLEVSFKTLLGSEEKASKLLKEIRQFAVSTPMQLGDLAGGAQTMLGFGIEAEKIMPLLKQIGDVAQGNSQKFQSLTLAFSQATSTGKLMGQDLLQLINAGFNPLNEMSKTTGKSISELKEDMSKGAISAEMLADAFKSATSEGGMFYNALADQSETINGAMSNLQGAWDDMLNEIGEQSQEALVGTLTSLTEVIKNYKSYISVILGLAAAYGTYKAVLMATVAIEKSNNISKSISLIIRLKKEVGLLTAAQRALNIAVSANPYVMLASAIAGIVGVISAYAVAESNAKTAAEKYNDEKQKSIEKEDEHRRKVEQSLQLVKDEIAGDEERREALAALRAEYPKIFEKYDMESIKLAEILDLKHQIAEEDAKRKADSDSQSFQDLEKEISRYETLVKSAGAGGGGYRKKLQELRETRDAILKDRASSISEQYISGLKEIDPKEFDRYIEELKRRIQGKNDDTTVKMKLPTGANGTLSDEAIYSVSQLKNLIKQTRVIQNDRKNPLKEDTYNEEYERAKKNWEDAKKKLAEIEKDKNAYTAKQYKEAKEAEEKAQKEYKDLGGDVKDKTQEKKKAEEDKFRRAKANAELIEMQKKQDKEALRAKEDSILATNQAEIDLLNESTDKTLKQIDQDYEEEKLSIERWYEDLLETKTAGQKALWEKDPQNEKKIWNDAYANVSYTPEETKEYEAKIKSIEKIRKSAREEVLKEERQKINEFLIEYGNYEEKKLAITENYERQINEESSIAKKTSLKLQMEKELGELSYNELNKSLGLDQVFENLQNQSISRLKTIKKEIQDAFNLKNIDANNAKILKERLDEIEEELVKRGSIIGQLMTNSGVVNAMINQKVNSNKNDASKKAYETYSKIADEADKAIKELKQEIREMFQNVGQEISDQDISVSNADNLMRAFGQNGQATTEMSDKLQKLGKAQAQATQASEGMSKAMGQMSSSAGGMASTVAIIDAIVHGINDNVQSTVQLLKDLELEDTEFGRKFSSFAKASQGATDAWEGLKSGNIAELIRGVYHSWHDLIGVFNTGNMYDLNKEIERLSIANEGLAEAVSDLTETLEKGSVSTADETYEKALDLLQKQEKNSSRILVDESVKWENGGHSLAYNFNKNAGNRNALQKAGDLLDTNISTLQEFLQLSSNQMKELRMADVDLYNQIMQGIKDAETEHTSQNLVDKIKEYISDYAGKAEELSTQLIERLTDTSFDSIESEFKSTLSDMNASAQDFTDNFEEMMRNSVINALISNNFSEDLKIWQEEFARAMQSDGIDIAEKEYLQNRWEEITGAALQQKEDALYALGLDPGHSSSTTSKSVSSMSQDTANELNGRFTAFQISNESINQQMTVALERITEMQALKTGSNKTLSEIQDALAISNTYLKDIAAACQACAKYADQLETIANNTKNI